MAVGYARVMMLAMPGLLVFILYTQLMRGVGDTLTPLYALVLSTSVSCVMTPAFIRGWWGLPQLGVTSARGGVDHRLRAARSRSWPGSCAAATTRWRPTSSCCARCASIRACCAW